MSLMVALALPALVFFAFPYSALRFAPREAVAFSPAFAAFLTLTPDQEVRVMQRAKAIQRMDAADDSVRPVDLIFGALPDDRPEPIGRLSDRVRPHGPAPVSPRATPYLPTQAAPPPVALPAEDTSVPMPFTKEELLKLD